MAAIQETKLIFYTGKEIGNREFGVTFVVDKSIKGSFLCFKAMNDRMCVLHIKFKFFNISLIHVHAPAEDKNDFLRDDLCQELEKVYDSVAADNIIIVLGYLNARVGEKNDPQRNHKVA
jgi:hypothetical protein